MKIRDRIVELRRVRAAELLPDPANWRVHPAAQQDALRGVLAEIGFANAVLARETPEGLMLIDGHRRADTVADSEIPVLVLDVDADEAHKLLATMDPIGALATGDPEKLKTLVGDLSFTADAVNNLLADLLAANGVISGDVQPFQSAAAWWDSPRSRARFSPWRGVFRCRSASPTRSRTRWTRRSNPSGWGCISAPVTCVWKCAESA